ncbi:MAG: HD domain-containing protein [Candidatus Omnitrophica bacterium]|nr:HD domain-containing protein [Candidatus Omnitrophota bacterium]
MMLFECPGAKRVKQPRPEDIKCPHCGYEVEIWTDEIEVICPKCKDKVLHLQDGVSCLDWCRSARECVGKEVYDKYIQNRTITMKQNLLKELEIYFGNDKKRINHARKVMYFAEKLLRLEEGDWHIVIPAAILHDVGIKIAEEKYGSSAGYLQEKEGPAVANGILLKLGVKKEDIDEINEIIANHHSPGKVDTRNFKILYDADWLVNLKDEVDTKDKIKLKEIIDKVFLTKTAKALAEKIYLS